MLDIFNSDAFSLTSMEAAIKQIPYKPSRLGPGGLSLFDERSISSTSIAVESQGGQLSLIEATPRGAAGVLIGDTKRTARSFSAQHLRRSAKVMADEVQGVRVFGSDDQSLTIEMKRNEKLAILQAMHEVTWEYHRVGALLGNVLDADGTTILLNLFTEFGVSQQVKDFVLSTTTLDVRSEGDIVADLIDDELGGTNYDHVHVLCGGTFYDTLIKHKYVQDALKAQLGGRLFDDLRQGFTIGALTFERAKRWTVKNAAGATITMIPTNLAYAFPVGASTPEGNIFIGRFAPQPFLDTVNRLNPPLVVVSVVDPAQQYVELVGISCPLYLNTRPRAVIKLTMS